ncbi:MAG: TonB-dependent siderophore receptor [Asticcacaulis sp.]|uniref:TonB-dependent siderophore receptor n=1 Tax=Asticcacaulis sp. TaxID=1872648 RepID=UPI0039E65183
MKKLSLLAVTGLVSVFAVSAAWADDAATYDNDGNQVVTVNGKKVEKSKAPSTGPWGAKSLQDTPYSINVTTSDLIENVVAGNMDQIYKMNPIVQNSAPSTVYGTPYAAIRGFHTQSGVMDGLRLSSTSTSIAMEELERVEVMNGLSGFMYGVGNPGGVTNYVLKRPTYHQLTNVTVGNYGGGQYFAHLDLGNKIDEDGKFAYRLNLSSQNGDTTKKGQSVERDLVSGALDWNVTSDLKLQVEAAHIFNRIDGIDSRFYAYANSSYGALSYWIEPLDNSKTYTPDWTYLQIKTDRIGVNGTWKLNDVFSLRSAYIYKRDEQESINIYPAYFADSGYVNGWPSRSAPSYNIAQGAYVYLDSVFSTGSIQHRLTTGVSTDVLEVDNHVKSSVSASNSPAYTDPDDLMSWAMPEALNNTDWGAKYKASYSTNTNIIVGDDITFNDRWSALIGFNGTHIETKNYSSTGTLSSSYDKSVVTPNISVIYKPTPKLTTYATYMEGLEKGTTVPNDATLYTNPGQILDPYISKQYEVGSKYAWSDAVLLTGALYRIEKANSYQEVGSDGRTTINQDGVEVHQGVEFTITGKVTQNLTLIAGGSVLDLNIEKATNAALEGKQPTGVAGNLAKLYAEYSFPQVPGLTVTGGAYYTGSMYKDSANLQKIDSSTIYDMGLRYRTEIAHHMTSFNLNVSNLTDVNYWATTYSLGIPRTVAFSIKTEF